MIIPHHDKWPRIHETAFVAPSADIIGEVEIGENSSIWFQCVVRGDVNSIRIGARTNIQDSSTIHVTRQVSATVIGDDVTVGHRALLHGCRIGHRVLIGMGAIVMDDVEIGDDSIVAAGALVPKGKKFPPGSLILGSPAKATRELTSDEREFLKRSADNYVRDSQAYKSYVRGPVLLGNREQDLEDPFVEEPFEGG
ncbi:MAG: gamma carbonic anhydrase family protein [Bacteriovoracia bacterium]